MIDVVSQGQVCYNSPEVISQLTLEGQGDRELVEKAAKFFCDEIKLPLPAIHYTSSDRFMGYAQTYHRVIRMSRWYMSKASTYEMIETIQHELLHLKTRKHGHGIPFQRLCNKYGVDARAESPILLPRCMDWVHYLKED